MRAERLEAAVAQDRYRADGEIDEQLLAREVPMAHRVFQTLLPTPINQAERATAVRRGAKASGVFFPQQLQGDMTMALQLAMDPRAVRRHQGGRLGCQQRP